MNPSIFTAFLLACSPPDAERPEAAPLHAPSHLVDPAFFAANGIDWSDEIVETRAENSLTFRKPDGTRVAVLSTGPLAYRGEEGAWALMDPRVADVGAARPAAELAPIRLDVPDGEAGPMAPHRPPAAGEATYRWADETNGLKSYYPDDARDGVLTLHDGLALRWVPLGRQVGADVIPPAAGTPELGVDGFRYRDTYPDTTEEFLPGPGRLEHNFVLAAPPVGIGDLLFRGRLEASEDVALWADGVRQTGAFTTSGDIEVREGGETVLLIQAPVAYERADLTQRIRLEHRVEVRDGQTELAVAVPLDWLNAPERQYPVVVDPTEKAYNPATYWASIERKSSCTVGVLYRFAASTFAGFAGFEDAGGAMNDYCDRSVAKFDTSGVPDGAAVSRVEFNAYGLVNVLLNDTAGAKDVDFSQISSDPVTQSDLSLWNDTAPGADDYTANVVAPLANNWFGSNITLTGVSLGGTALTDFTANLSLDWFAVGMHRGDHAVEFTPNGADSYLQLAAIVAGREPQLYVTYAGIVDAVASNASGTYLGAGIQTGDQVRVQFSETTNAYAVTAANINTVLAPSGGHTWGTISSAAWYTTRYANDTLIVTLSTVGAPTLVVGDTLTVGAATITTGGTNPGRATVRGSFGGGTMYYVSKAGSDPALATCTGTTRENDVANPFLTIQGAVDCLKGNHANSIAALGAFVIQVEDTLTYAEAVTISGLTTNATGFLTLRKNPTLTGKPTITGSGAREYGVLVESPYTVIDGFKVTNFISITVNAVAIMVKTTDVEILNNTLSGPMEYGVSVGYDALLTPTQYLPSHRVNLYNNTIYDASIDCVILLSSSSDWTVNNNTFDDCDLAAIETWDDLRGPEAYGTFRNNVAYARLVGTKLVKMQSLIDGGQLGLVSNYNDLYTTAGAKTGTWDLIDQLTLANWQAASTQDANSIAADPQFSGVVGDYHEKSTAGRYLISTGLFVLDATSSPTIDLGDSATYVGTEPTFSGCRANQGAFGGTAEASKSGTLYRDADGDGFGDPLVTGSSCPLVGAYVANDDDCDDTNATINQFATEVVADGIDQNCDGGDTCFADADDDGYRPDASATVLSVDLDCADPFEADATQPTDDCNDANAAINPGAAEIIGDGIDQDCSGGESCYTDADNDGYRPDAFSTVESADADCNDAFEAVSADPTTDCNDANAAINPLAIEITGDGIDQNCNGTETCYRDADNDGYRPDAVSTTASADPDCNDAFEALATDPTTDCNDANAAINPGAAEITGDGIDQNCNGTETCYRDADDDTYRPDAVSTTASADADCADAFEATLADPLNDCNDLNAAINPGALEITGDGIDQNCDTLELCYRDADDDTYRPDAVSTTASADPDCSDPFEAVGTDLTTDCNDTNAAINPGAAEITGDGIDQNCNGTETCFRDADDDGYRPDAVATTPSADVDCTDAFEAVGTDPTTDCNDLNAAINPAAVEITGDGIDQNCNGTETCYRDADDDTYRPDAVSTTPSADTDCTDAFEAIGTDPTTDCNDTNAAINPAAIEITGDGIDQNCNGTETCYRDADDDTYRPDAVSTTASADADCTDAFEAVATDPTTDCNDTNPAINPGALEITGDGIDQNCDTLELCYRDADDDTYRPDAVSTTASADPDCTDAFEAVGTDPTTDCNDANAAINPAAAEITGDGIDQNCNGTETCYRDADNDTYRPDAISITASVDTDCTDAFEAVATDPTTDCNDTNAAINPAAVEITGDGIDQNCDGTETCYRDADDDGYRPDAVSTTASVDGDCLDPFEAVSADPTTDCNDTNAAINPGAAEITGDGIDQNCDGAETCFLDADDDGWRPSLTATVASADKDCTDPSEALASDGTGDCADGDPTIYPGATELCDGIDQDCDGAIDDGNDADADGAADICDVCPGFDDSDDADADTVPDGCDVCAGGDDTRDADADTVPDACDACEGFADDKDDDFDGVPDDCDVCPAADDLLDADGDGVPDGCDVCEGDDDSFDNDGDAVPDACDACPGADDSFDADFDTVPDGCDVCPGGDDTIDTDFDGIPNACDACISLFDADLDGVPDDCDLCPLGDDALDADFDTVADACDACPGNDDADDADGDDVPDGCDACPGADDGLDADSDGVPNACDQCAAGDDALDADGDGVADACDLCLGDDTADADADGTPDACDVCPGGDDGDDIDADGTPDACDACPGGDDDLDADNDGTPDACDACPGGDDSLDADNDGTPDACDVCPAGDDDLDTDGDSVADACDACPGADDGIDADGDGVADGCDACPAGDDNDDADGDGVADACDACPAGDDNVDADNDGVANACDACPLGDDGLDADGDNVADACDLCPGEDDALDADADGVADGCDVCPAGDDALDTDGDTVADACDACPGGDDTLDADADTVPDACDVCAAGDDALDADGDAVPDACDLCPGGDDALDTDSDGIPNDCDSCSAPTDFDGDGVPDDCDVCPLGDDALDTDGDTVADACDACALGDDAFDTDGDTVPDACDACPGDDDTADLDADGVPDGCDACPGGNDSSDGDADGVPDACDACAGGDDALDTDGDTVADACDACPLGDDALDTDGDGVPDACDVCPLGDDAIDSDSDGVPNACDTCSSPSDGDGDGVPDDCDLCPLGDDAIDNDGDQVADACDACPAGDDTADADGDTIPDNCDACPGGDDAADADADGVANACDACPGGDDAFDADFDAVPDDCDLCAGGDDLVDSDGDGTPNFCDSCSALTDADFDGVVDDCDACPGGDDAIDTDGDGVPNGCDTCVSASDADGDGVPDDCDACPVGDDAADTDGDGLANACDLCASGDDNFDTDGDAVADACDTCPTGDDQLDADSDGAADACDLCLGADDALDGDADGVPDGCDLCLAGDDAIDTDGDGIPNACDTCVSPSDTDADGVPDDCDLCPLGDDGLDADNDQIADACDACPAGDDLFDSDADGIADACDACPGGDDAVDADADGVANFCDACPGADDTADADADAVPDACDLCPTGDDADDSDGDGIPNACDACSALTDDDFDGVPDDCDACPGGDDGLDTDADGIPNGCDTCTAATDADGDSVADDCDICPAGDDAADADADGAPDACDTCPAGDNAVDADTDGTADLCDACPGFDDRVDTDVDSVPDGCDVCPTGDDADDADGDGIPNACDTCLAPTDADGDGVPDDCDLCPAGDDNADADADGAADACDTCPAGDNALDADADGAPDACDACPGFDDTADGDLDGAPDGCDACPGADDALDGDGDGLPDGCDTCIAATDADGDGVPDDCDVCPIGDDALDGDADTIPDACDVCPAGDDLADADADGAADGCDACPGFDDRLDADFDGAPDDCDVCPGADDALDTDADGVPNGCDTCLSPLDTDGDGVPDDCDLCPAGDDALDTDGDATPDACDVCPSNAGNPDLDGDGFLVCVDDCFDTDPLSHPGAGEIPDGIDQDCDGTVDNGTIWGDDDGDGATEAGGDCDDADPGVHPGALELCDTVDEDCDGETDEDTTCSDDDGDGFSEDAGDCADADAAVSPGAAEIADNDIDDDCDGAVDAGVLDSDLDGVTDAVDCDPFDAAAFPGNTELSDGIDNDCDGAIDEGTGFGDDDGDGVTEDDGDCDDSDVDIVPGGEEIANGRDDDCDGQVDEGTTGGDDDGDGVTEDAGDCDDTDANVHPFADEVPNGDDDDCDGQVDEGLEDYDNDGWTIDEGDCDDQVGWASPEVAEVCDRIDNDCDGMVDEDCEDVQTTPKVAPGGCGCETNTPGAPWLAVALLALVARRRRAA